MHKHYWLFTALDDIHQYGEKNKVINFLHLIEAARSSIAYQILADLSTGTGVGASKERDFSSSFDEQPFGDLSATIEAWDEDLVSLLTLYH